MSDETTTNEEVEAHGGTFVEDLVENTLEAQDDTPDVEGHGFNMNTMENTMEDLVENTME